MDILTREEVAKILNTSLPTVTRLIKQNNLPATIVGRGYIIVASELKQWLIENQGNWKQCTSTKGVKIKSGGLTWESSTAEGLDKVLKPNQK